MAISHEWDKRYSNPEFIYGLEPNEYFQQELSRLNPVSFFCQARARDATRCGQSKRAGR